MLVCYGLELLVEPLTQPKREDHNLTADHQVQFRVRLLIFFNLPNPSSRTMALEFTRPLIEMSSRKYF
jgi:hypothetical protein